MSTFVFSNNMQTTLAAAITSTGQTSITLTSTANFPTIPPGDYWAVTLNDVATGTFFEIVYVTSISGAVLTVLRGQEGTAARTWLVGDNVYGAVTAAELTGFVQGGGNFVEISPGSAQTGFIDITGAGTFGGAGSFGAGVGVGGALTGATTGNFSGDVTAQDFLASRAYAGTSLANLPLRVNGNTGVIGIGPSSALTAQGITATALAVGLAGSSNFVVIDTSGNLAATGNIKGTDGIFSTEVDALTIKQNSNQVLDTVTSTGNTIGLNRSGGSLDVESPIIVCNARLRWNQTANASSPLPSGDNNFANYPSILGGCSSPMWGTAAGSIQIGFGIEVKGGAGAQSLSGVMVPWSNGSGYVFLDGVLQASTIGLGPQPLSWTASIPDDSSVHQLVFLMSGGNQVNGITVGAFLPTNSIGGLDTTKIALVQAGT